jgi:hypothetical protein
MWLQPQFRNILYKQINFFGTGLILEYQSVKQKKRNQPFLFLIPT